MVENADGERLQMEREEDGKKIRRYHTVEMHLARQYSDITFRWEVEDEKGYVETFSTRFGMRWFHRFELEHLLARTGFQIEALYGDFQRGPLTADSGDMIFVAKPAG